MMYTVEYKEQHHYPILKTWWEAHRWPAPPATALSKTGIVVNNNDNKPLCAGFVYRTDSDFGVIEFIISDPSSDKNERRDALDVLVKTLVAKTQELGHPYIFTSTGSKPLIDRLTAHGFAVTDTGITNLLRSSNV